MYDAYTNPEYTRFALKVTLGVMLAYFAEDMLNWPGIHTVVITCFFVSLGTVGDSLHKATLRLSGCIVGAVLGIGTILLLMPAMTDLGQLLLVVAAVTFMAAWIGFGSGRLSDRPGVLPLHVSGIRPDTGHGEFCSATSSSSLYSRPSGRSARLVSRGRAWPRPSSIWQRCSGRMKPKRSIARDSPRP